MFSNKNIWAILSSYATDSEKCVFGVSAEQVLLCSTEERYGTAWRYIYICGEALTPHYKGKKVLISSKKKNLTNPKLLNGSV